MLRYLKNKDVPIISFLQNYVDVQSQTDTCNTLIFFIHFFFPSLSLSLSYLLSIQVCFVQAMAAIRVLRSAATFVSLYCWYAKFHSASPPSAIAVQ